MVVSKYIDHVCFFGSFGIIQIVESIRYPNSFAVLSMLRPSAASDSGIASGRMQ